MYPATSPYYTTESVNEIFLDVMNNRTIVSDPTDIYWEITSTYHLRPDLLAHDLYNDSRLWWVFAARNPNSLQDPLFDFVQGKSIYLPQQTLINSSLGL